MKRMQRCLAVLAALIVTAAALAPTAHADTFKSRVDPPHLSPLYMRHTVAAASQPNWNLPQFNVAFIDSFVFRNTSAAVLSNNDTTQAIPVINIPMADPANNALTVGDTLSAPWCALVVRANTSAVPVFLGTTTLDSVYVSAQWSHDGATWADADGTPTKTFFAANVSPTTLISLFQIEQTNLAPIPVYLACAPGLAPLGDAIVINRNLCMSGGFIRFVINTGAGTGQYTAALLRWGD